MWMKRKGEWGPGQEQGCQHPKHCREWRSPGVRATAGVNPHPCSSPPHVLDLTLWPREGTCPARHGVSVLQAPWAGTHGQGDARPTCNSPFRVDSEFTGGGLCLPWLVSSPTRQVPHAMRASSYYSSVWKNGYGSRSSSLPSRQHFIFFFWSFPEGKTISILIIFTSIKIDQTSDLHQIGLLCVPC